MRIAILTSSDSAARAERPDESGTLLSELASGLGDVVDYRIVPDEPQLIERQLWQWIRQGIDVIATTGATGLGPRDVMPEVTRRVIDREIPGMAEAMRAVSVSKTPFGMISRQVVGVADATLVVNFPGSPRAVAELWPVIASVIPHVVDLIHGQTRHGTDANGTPEPEKSPDAS
jgi:molybdopterin adenylyltransferase